ncbi:hypothetical protein [Flagellimonas profundi]|uniref:Outer membrane protein beta-barrel domain-containing protein n=1 Tax=Flagellimonas profundi TaxID=2915620 RepID=A0ABS3FLA3_9FLAO|nr:hypothetical protein [Allomuricauda profundi]MBO0343495.1 hypothetical protein [Allomuricauda profundi]
MEIHKGLILVLLALTMPKLSLAQELKPSLFVRTPQIANYNINTNEVSYTPILSIGAGLSYKSEFIELAAFVDATNQYGFYTFFGTTLKTNEIQRNLYLNVNWFGEVTYIPKQHQDSDSFVHTTGISLFLNHSFDWGSIGIPLCIGFGYSNKTISLNTRTILNISLNLN